MNACIAAHQALCLQLIGGLFQLPVRDVQYIHVL